MQRNGYWLLLFILPGLLVMSVFMLVPAFSTFFYSLFNWHAFSRAEFVWLGNFRRLITEPFFDQFLAALAHNSITFAAVLIVQNGLALALALGLYRRPWGFRFFRATAFLPVILSFIVAAYLWNMLLNPLFGPLTEIAMKGFGLEEFVPLGDSRFALATAILISIWRNLGFPTLVFLAGMNAIPEDLYKAAQIDGASEWQTFRNVTLPLLGPSFTVIAVLSFIGAYEWFELPFVIGGTTGDPANSLDTLVLMFYRLSFGDDTAASTDVGLGAAVSVVLFVIVLAGSHFGSRYLRRREVQI